MKEGANSEKEQKIQNTQYHEEICHPKLAITCAMTKLEENAKSTTNSSSTSKSFNSAIGREPEDFKVVHFLLDKFGVAKTGKR